MNINLGYGALNSLQSKTQRFHFYSLYGKSPEEFIEKYSEDWIPDDFPDDLKGKYVVSLEERIEEIDFESEGFYCFRILGIYTPREDQVSTLSYYRHIAFVDIRNTNGDQVALLYKDDECFPQNFSDWYGNFDSNADCYEGKFPTKEEFISLIELMIKSYSQNPHLQLEISEDDIIILQGL